MLSISLPIAAAVMALPAVHAHGWMQEPLGRQWCNDHDNIILSAGDGCTRHAGETDVSQNCGVPGVCGDRFETHGDSRPVSSDVNSACPSKATWTEGQTISLEIAVGTNHGGLWNVNVCPCTSCDDSDLTQSCFNENRLISVETGTTDWWITSTSIENPTDDNPDVYTTEWKLPSGLTCDKCVIQWRWWAAASCIPKECSEDVCGFYANLKNEIEYPGVDWTLDLCNNLWPSSGTAPQMFHNCADVTIEQSKKTECLAAATSCQGSVSGCSTCISVCNECRSTETECADAYTYCQQKLGL